MSRSEGRANEERTLRSVVFPDPVPPDTTMFIRARTQVDSRPITADVTDPADTRSAGANGRSANLRMVMTGPQSERGGMIAFTREPSWSRASTNGDDSSTLRPSGATMRSIK